MIVESDPGMRLLTQQFPLAQTFWLEPNKIILLIMIVIMIMLVISISLYLVDKGGHIALYKNQSNLQICT